MDYPTEQVDSVTYKLRPDPQNNEHAMYFTIAGGTEPQWFFVNSKAMDSFQWVTALMTSYSIQIKDGRPVESVIKQMKETFSPGGSYPLEGTTEMVPSVVHHLGLILEKHIAGET